MFKPAKEDLERPVKVRDLIEFKDELGDFLDEKMATKQDLVAYKDEIMMGQDKISKKLDQVLTEQASIGGRLDEHGERIERLEARASA
ncbi:MAG: hypothetical protein HYT31_01340 [Parcubacteria group bacterium]|nr:hypothetical protein [Parcubacteria group bacterium]